MSEALKFEEASTLTDRYQTTVPETVRRVLNLHKRDRIYYSIAPTVKCSFLEYHLLLWMTQCWDNFSNFFRKILPITQNTFRRLILLYLSESILWSGSAVT